ncbi:hypothetical protein GCM10009020_18840 [Natronoarchaeum mannanilyticum]|uniref:Uncharacterized protein n=1 Tax=Natronoarchaeum mannanilyticum TaxID=926360 RepID=A0AAV3T997_9EURY
MQRRVPRRRDDVLGHDLVYRSRSDRPLAAGLIDSGRAAARLRSGLPGRGFAACLSARTGRVPLVPVARYARLLLVPPLLLAPARLLAALSVLSGTLPGLLSSALS